MQDMENKELIEGAFDKNGVQLYIWDTVQYDHGTYFILKQEDVPHYIMLPVGNSSRTITFDLMAVCDQVTKLNV